MSKRSEWDVLKEHHRFVRDDEEPSDVSWEERLARAYESKLFKEFALIDLKHFKSKKFALRWRTATEVVEGLGEDTCASLRCPYHNPSSGGERIDPGSLRSFELPFVYEENGRRKEALVKVRLCAKCTKKLTWKPEDDGKRRRSESPRREERRRRRSKSPRPREEARHGSRDSRGYDEDRRDRDREQKRDRNQGHHPRDRERGLEHDRDGQSRLP